MSKAANTKPIMFTQYLRPDGRKAQRIIDRHADVADKAELLATAGWQFEVEVLATREVSITCTQFDSADDAGECFGRCLPNGPGIAEAVDEIVNETFAFHTKDGAPCPTS
jgi:hypothetical protein